ncbi:MAG TPA: 16S rRNA (adenine(1518)-N(6)/adenine(1519)-N(6))-dimethyltransferase RsmA, partial [Spongiibacteraceae bacterium]|nr:16S rRNA (adenine(1518)-N(6)/adenine(1519)-N(6))-dimethyltransferase RsmA [Spongiibacteraceae bacterium]
MIEHRARKRFGQNFLHDKNIIDRIVRAIRPRPGETLLEIGPGQGAITSELLASGCELYALELDRDLVEILQRKFHEHPNFHLQQGDALELDLQTLIASAGLTPSTKFRVVGNLPYNISTPLIFYLLAQNTLIADMHFMLQKEVVERLAAEANTKEYGRLGIMTQYFCRIEPLLEVPPGAFSPRPKVQSAVVRLTPYATLPHPAKSVENLQHVVRTAFNQRRKTLRNALQTLLSADDIAACDIDPGVRPETLT